MSKTNITNAGEGLDSDEFDALSEANWLKELSENGFDFKAQIVSDDSYSGENDILECESKCKEFNSKRCSFMYDNGWGFDIIENPHDGFKPCNDIWSQEPVEMTLIFKCKKTGKKYKYVSECSIGADTFDEIMDDDYNLECGCFTLTPDGSDSWTLEEIDFDNLHYSKEFVPIDGGEILDDDVDEYDFDEEFELVDAETGCESPASITIPEDDTLKIPKGVTMIGDSAFKDCKSLASVTIPKTVTKIYFKAFSGCESLASVTIPETVTEIYPEAFSNCKSLASVTIPEGVTEIYDSAFSGCESLASVIFTGTKQQWEALDRCIPSSVKTIKCSDGTIER